MLTNSYVWIKSTPVEHMLKWVRDVQKNMEEFVPITIWTCDGTIIQLLMERGKSVGYRHMSIITQVLKQYLLCVVAVVWALASILFLLFPEKKNHIGWNMFWKFQPKFLISKSMCLDIFFQKKPNSCFIFLHYAIILFSKKVKKYWYDLKKE